MDRIHFRLKRLQSRVATALFIDGVARFLGVLFLAIAISFVADRIFKLELAARGVLLLGMLAAFAWTVWHYLVSRLGAVPGEDPLAIDARELPKIPIHGTVVGGHVHLV